MIGNYYISGVLELEMCQKITFVKMA